MVKLLVLPPELIVMSSIADHADHSPTHRNGPAHSRIAYLDGLRGVAILLVVLFHSYSRWSDKIPALTPFKDIWLLNTKVAGVQLFFFISGFVILMTLERTQGFGIFMLLRWRRLFPAMLVCSIIIFATAGLLPERPTGQPRLIDLLPGLSLLGDRFWGLFDFAISPPPKSIEGAFWSLYVEVVFYLVFGFTCIKKGAGTAISLLIWIGTLTSVFYVISYISFPPFTLVTRLDKILHISHVASIFGLRFYIWFAAGAFAWLASRTPDDRRLLWAAMACLAFGAATSVDSTEGSVLVALIAAGALISPFFQRVLALPVLTFLGFISYPLYLNHENLIVALMLRLQTFWPSIPPSLLPVLPMLVAGLIATLVATYAEPFARRMIDALIARLMPAERLPQPQPTERPRHRPD